MFALATQALCDGDLYLAADGFVSRGVFFHAFTPIPPCTDARAAIAFFVPQNQVRHERAPRRPSMPTRPGPRRHAPDGAIVLATPADLAYVVDIQKRNGEALGFIPRVALAEKIELGRITLATENGEPAGYLHHGSLAVPEVRIFQAAIQYDARRRHH